MKHANHLLLLILLVGLVVRLINLDTRPIWYDEAFTILYSEKSYETMLAGTITQVDGVAADVHPLFFYSIVHNWMKVAGQSPAGVRSLSVIFSTATIFVVYHLARRLVGERGSGIGDRDVLGQRVGLLAAGFTALSPFVVYYGQEARMYALLGLAATTTAYFFIRAWSDGGWRSWVAFGFFGAITLYSHNLGAFFIAAIDLWVLWYWVRHERWRNFKQIAVAHVVMLVVFAPWLLILPSQLGKVNQAYWVTRPGLASLLQTLLIFHFAYDNQALPEWLLPIALLFSILLPSLLLLEGIRRPPRPRPGSFQHPLSFLSFLTILPVLLAFLVSQIQPIYIVRALIPSAIIYTILAAYLLMAGKMPRPIRWGILIPTALIALASLGNHYTYATFPRAPFADFTADWPGDGLIIHSNKLTFLPAYYYDRTLPQAFIADEPGSPSDTLALPTQQALNLFATPDLATAIAGQNEVWFVIFEAELVEWGDEHPHLDWLNTYYTLTDTQTYNDLLVYRYIVPR